MHDRYTVVHHDRAVLDGPSLARSKGDLFALVVDCGFFVREMLEMRSRVTPQNQ